MTSSGDLNQSRDDLRINLMGAGEKHEEVLQEFIVTLACSA